jgi:hypothetical protein
MSEAEAQCNCCNETVWEPIVVEIEHVARPVLIEIMRGMPALKMACVEPVKSHLEHSYK